MVNLVLMESPKKDEIAKLGHLAARPRPSQDLRGKRWRPPVDPAVQLRGTLAAASRLKIAWRDRTRDGDGYLSFSFKKTTWWRQWFLPANSYACWPSRAGGSNKLLQANESRGIVMGRYSRHAYEDALGLREVETCITDAFEAEFPVITRRRVKILSVGEAPDRLARIDDVETGVELSAIKADGAEHIQAEIWRIANQKHATYTRQGIFDTRPIILLAHLDWPAKNVEGRALYDVWQELEQLIVPSEFASLGFSEIWLMDSGAKYSSRRDPRMPADFFCLKPIDKFGFWQRERRRQPYWDLISDQIIML